MLDLQDRAKHESMPGETNVFHLTIAHNPSTSGSSAYRLELTDTFPADDLQFLGASLLPDQTNGNQYIWSNATLMAAIPFQTGGPFAITSAPISLSITTLTLVHCVPSAANTASLVYGCETSPCQTATATAVFTTTAQPVLSSPANARQLNSCGGSYTVSLRNDGAVGRGILWTNLAPAGYLITSAQVSGAMTNPVGQSATVSLAGSPFGRIAILDLTSTNITNVRALHDYDGDPATLDLGPGETITVTFSLVSDGSTWDCVVNTYPPSPTPVTTTNLVSIFNYCGVPVSASSTYTALPDQPKPAVTITPKSLIVTNGQVQDYVITINNIGDHGAASNLQARVQLGYGWTNLSVVGIVNNTGGGAINTGGITPLAATNGLNGVLVDLTGIVLEPQETVVLTVHAQAVAAGNSLQITAEVVGQCDFTSTKACATFSPSDPLALTMPPGGGIEPVTNRTLYGFYQDYAAGVGFNLSKSVRYSGEPPTAAGTNRVARIGEHLTYRITAQFFNAAFTNIVINDTLPPNVVFGTPVDAGSSYNVELWTFNPLTGDFALPTPVTSDALFVVDLPVVVTNGLLNQEGVSFTNAATVAFTTVVSNLPSPAYTVVSNVEPTLNVSTLVSTTQNSFGPALTGLQANDQVFFQIVVTNGPGTNAYDLWLSNSLPAGYTAAALVSLTAVGNVFTNGVLAVGDLDPRLLSLSGKMLTIADANVFELGTNSAFVILLSARLDYAVNPNQNLTNSTTIRWASMPGVEAQKRTGGSLTPGIGTNASADESVLDNYAATSGAAVATVGLPTFAKVLVGTELETAGNLVSNQATIGELVTYSLTVTVPQGVTPNAQVVDSLHPGMAFVDVTGVSYSSGVSSANTIALGSKGSNVSMGDTNAGTGNWMLFSLGNVTNLDNDPVTADSRTPDIGF